MRVQIQLRIVTDDETVLREDVIACFDKGDDQLEEIGLSLEQAKTVLAGAQTRLVRHRRRVSWHGIGAVSCAVGTSRAKDAAAFCSAPRSAPSRWSVHAFTAAPASPQAARPSARSRRCLPSTPPRSCFTWRPAGRH